MIVPLYIEETREQFFVRPLFALQPVAKGDLLSRAMNKLLPALRKDLERLGAEERHDAYARFAFSPQTETLNLKTILTLRRESLDLRLLVVCFRALDRRIAFSPTLPALWFEVQKGQRVEARAIEVYTEHFKNIEKESLTRIKSPSVGFLRGWVHLVDLDVVPIHNTEKPQKKKFMALEEPAPVSGREELGRIGRRLESLYPDDLQRAVRREPELAELTRLLTDIYNHPVLLVGPAMVGKTALIHEFVFQRLAAAEQPHALEKNLWLISPQRLISGMMYAGQWESRLLAILNFARSKKLTLYFDDLPGLFHAGISSSADLSVAQVLRPYIERREVRILGEITPEAFRILQERDRGFTDLFHVLRIAEPSADDAQRILISVVRQLEGLHRCRFALDVLPTLADLQSRYARELAMPGKVAGILRRLAAKFAKNDITRDMMLEEYHARTGIALTLLDRRCKLERREVVSKLAADIEGQPAAIGAMADAVSIAKAQLNDPGRPLATLLFLGPTGVGKTQSAKALAKFLFADAARLTRLDMNEYIDAYSAARLVGTWSSPEGLLTSAIRRQPYAVILLDEIEKAHPDVHDMLLQVLGEGRLTDSLGRTADFTNAVIILTSNLGVREAQTAFGFGPPGKSDSSAYAAAAERFFRPEFFNRIDRIVPFDRLSRDHTRHIAQQLIDDVFQRDGLRQRRCILTVEPAAMERLVDAGYHPQLGARALKRAIEQQLTQQVASRLAALEPATPTLINVYPAHEGVSVALDPLRYAARFPAADLSDEEAALDGIEDAMDRLGDLIAVLQPKGRVALDNLSARHVRYFAMRDQLQRLESIFTHIVEPKKTPTQGRTRIGRNPQKISLSHVSAVPRHYFSGLFAAADIRQYLDELTAEARPLATNRTAQIHSLVRELALLQAMADGPADFPDRAVILTRRITRRAPRATFRLHGLHEKLLVPGINLAADLRKLLGKDHDFASIWYAALVHSPGARAIAATEAGTLLMVHADQSFEVAQTLCIPLDAEADPASIAANFFHRHEAWRAAVSAGDSSPLDDPFPVGPVIRVFDKQILDVRTGLMVPLIPREQDLRTFTLALLPPPVEVQVKHGP